MPEQKITYDERVTKTICELYSVEDSYEVSVEESFVAYNAIELQAEAIREALMSVYLEFGYTEGGAKHLVDSYLLEHGYKPKTEEDERN